LERPVKLATAEHGGERRRSHEPLCLPHRREVLDLHDCAVPDPVHEVVRLCRRLDAKHVRAGLVPPHVTVYVAIALEVKVAGRLGCRYEITLFGTATWMVYGHAEGRFPKHAGARVRIALTPAGIVALGRARCARIRVKIRTIGRYDDGTLGDRTAYTTCLGGSRVP
jgi:hypothetical protein